MKRHTNEELEYHAKDYPQLILDKMYKQGLYNNDFDIYVNNPQFLAIILENSFIAGYAFAINDEFYKAWKEKLKGSEA